MLFLTKPVMMVAASTLFGLGGFFLLTPKTVFTFRRSRAVSVWGAFRNSIIAAATERLSGAVLQALDAMGWPISRPLIISAGYLLIIEVPILFVSWWMALLALVPAALLCWKVGSWGVVRSYKQWQKDVMAGLPSLLSVLKVHLEMGLTVQDALVKTVPGVRGPLKVELIRTLSDMALARSHDTGEDNRPSEAKQALGRLRARVNTLEFSTFTDTLVQSWTSRLSGDALDPLVDLLKISKERTATETTSKLDMVMTIAPGLALLGIMIWAVGGYILTSVASGSL
ncbi:MAG: hypothetical protein ACYCRD_04875 [Leptospirillum sp.]